VITKNVIVQAARKVLISDESVKVIVEGPSKVITAGTQGPPGPPGASEAVTVTGGTGGVNAYQVVFATATADVQAANANEPSHCGRVIGMATAAIAQGDTGTVQQSGAITNQAWSLSPGLPYFLVSGGNISVNVPSSGFVQRIGTAKDATTLIVNMGEPIKI